MDAEWEAAGIAREGDEESLRLPSHSAAVLTMDANTEPAQIDEPTEEPCERERRDCETCADPFEALVLRVLGARIVARHCARCVNLHAADDARHRATLNRPAPPTPEQRWAEICPPEFRTIAEGGRTDVARLTAQCPHFYRIASWKYGDRGLMLRGGTGRGKTRAMWRLLRRLFDEGRTLEV
jgi:hypothetical protein